MNGIVRMRVVLICIMVRRMVRDECIVNIRRMHNSGGGLLDRDVSSIVA